MIMIKRLKLFTQKVLLHNVWRDKIISITGLLSTGLLLGLSYATLTDFGAIWFPILAGLTSLKLFFSIAPTYTMLKRSYLFSSPATQYAKYKDIIDSQETLKDCMFDLKVFSGKHRSQMLNRSQQTFIQISNVAVAHIASIMTVNSEIQVVLLKRTYAIKDKSNLGLIRVASLRQ